MAHINLTDVLGRQLIIGDPVSYETTDQRKGVSEFGLGSIKSIDASKQSVVIEISGEGRPSQFIPCELSATKLTKLE